MLRTVITVSDYSEISDGNAKIAIESAIALTNVVEKSIFFSAVGRKDKELENKGVETISLNQYDILNNPNRFEAIIQGIWNTKSKKELKKILKNKNPRETIIHVHSWTKAISSSIFKIAEKMGFKVVITLHDYFTICPNGALFDYKENKICCLKPMSVKCLLHNCDSRNYMHKLWRYSRQIVQNYSILKRKNISFIYISDFSKKVLEQQLKDKQFYKLTNPIEIKNRIKIEPEKNNIYLYLGRVVNEKGVRQFCEAISALNLNGIVIGNGYLLEELKNEFNEIEFTGWLNYDRIREYIIKARCMVFPSLWYETFGLTILEVSAFGVPCIVSDCCVGREFTSDKLLFSAGNTNSLKEKLILMKDDNTVKKFGADAYKYFDKNNQSVDVYAKKLIEIYGNILQLK